MKELFTRKVITDFVNFVSFLCTEQHFVNNNNDLKAVVHHYVSSFFHSLLLQFQVLNGSESITTVASLVGYPVAYQLHNRLRSR